ncbi:flagellar biosynthesis protein FliQ [Helicovermis profundi]|uniref:Flagellar biosynthetic protein FliQ n=1 Tax=Helicovermis profundi TaxID=3065157 RepID=A0AAU9E4L4_9FIRM|nr:flagellar biosynthesis protein FliQ [Clostridia bacterium S502]
MDESIVIDILNKAIRTILMLSAPMLVVALIVGLMIAIFQATTQIQEQTLAFVPKVLAIFLTLMFVGPWILKTLVDFTLMIFNYMETLVV